MRVLKILFVILLLIVFTVPSHTAIVRTFLGNVEGIVYSPVKMFILSSGSVLCFTNTAEGPFMGSWAQNTVHATDSIASEESSIMASDSSNVFAVYYKTGTADLAFAKSIDGGSLWTVTYPDTGGSVGNEPSIYALNSNELFVRYRDLTNNDLKFAKSTDGGSSWSISLIYNGSAGQAPGYRGSQSTIYAVDSNNLYVSYYCDGLAAGVCQDDLRFAKSTDGGGSWNLSPIDESGDVGSENAMDVVGGSNIYISYCQDTGQDLKFAKSDDSGSSWSVSTVDSGTVDCGVNNNTSIDALDNNNIFIAYTYYNAPRSELKFAASSNGGSNWTLSTIKASAANEGYSPQVKAYNQNLIFVVYAGLNGTILRIAKTEDGGTTWNESDIYTGSGTRSSSFSVLK